MIKLVATDIDGTLIPEGTDKLNPLWYDTIRELTQKGILFVAASGRQYGSMLHLFKPVADDVVFLSENGTNVIYQGKPISGDYIEPALAKEAVRYLQTFEECALGISTPEVMYVDKDLPGLMHILTEGYHNNVELVDDVLPYCDRTNKLCIYRAEGSGAIADEIMQRLGDRMNVAISGYTWIDFISLNAGKGRALEAFQRERNITAAETMAFGDNCNDLSMIQCAEESYAVTTAHPQLKEAAKYEVASYQEDGVLHLIRRKLLGYEA